MKPPPGGGIQNPGIGLTSTNLIPWLRLQGQEGKGNLSKMRSSDGLIVFSSDVERIPFQLKTVFSMHRIFRLFSSNLQKSRFFVTGFFQLRTNAF